MDNKTVIPVPPMNVSVAQSPGSSIITDIDLQNIYTEILDDLRNVLIDSVINAFYEKNKQTPNLEIEDINAMRTLKPFIMINLENTIFRRTANYSTAYGFI